jgi:putative transcriptional regulator
MKLTLLLEQGFLAWLLFLLFAGSCLTSQVSEMNNRIKEFRARYNLTQEDLAKKVKVRRETIVFLEKNKYNPSLKLAYDIARVFDVKIEEIFLFE